MRWPAPRHGWHGSIAAPSASGHPRCARQRSAVRDRGSDFPQLAGPDDGSSRGRRDRELRLPLGPPPRQDAFERLLLRLPRDILRAKGIVRFVDRDWHCLFNFTCGRHELSWLKLDGDAATENQAVFIGEGWIAIVGGSKLRWRRAREGLDHTDAERRRCRNGSASAASRLPWRGGAERWWCGVEQRREGRRGVWLMVVALVDLGMGCGGPPEVRPDGRARDPQPHARRPSGPLLHHTTSLRHPHASR